MLYKQRQFIHDYNKQFRHPFNKELFIRRDEELIDAMKNVVYSCNRNGNFVINVIDFEVISDYDNIIHILWEYEDSIINKGKKDGKKSSGNSKKKDNQFAFINLKDSDLILLKITYFIQITEKKNGLVSDTVTVYAAIPRIVDNFYFRLNGNVYSAMYQIVDASTYNNSAARNAKKQSITFKTVFMPIRIYRYQRPLIDNTGEAITTTYFVGNMFKKSLLVMKYIIAKMGIYEAMRFLALSDVFIIDDITKFNPELYYIFPVRDYYIVCPRILFDSNQIMQSFVYTLHSVCNYMKDCTLQQMFETKTWIKALGVEFTSKDINTIYDKGISILGSLEFIYDKITENDLKLPIEDKSDIYRVIRWMMYEFNSLRQKDNLDITTKKVRWAEYIASLYASKLAVGIYRISDKADKADLNTIRKAIQIPPMYLINAVTKCQLVNYKNCVNDLDAIIALKYTYKGVSGIGESSNAISDAYRSIHPSHLGRVDIDSSSNSDPGISGTIVPFVNLVDGHFEAYDEPNSWRNDLSKVMDLYKSMTGRTEMIRLRADHKLKQENNTVIHDSIEIAKALTRFPLAEYSTEEYINGFDIFGDDLMWFTEE